MKPFYNKNIYFEKKKIEIITIILKQGKNGNVTKIWILQHQKINFKSTKKLKKIVHRKLTLKIFSKVVTSLNK